MIRNTEDIAMVPVIVKVAMEQEDNNTFKLGTNK